VPRQEALGKEIWDFFKKILCRVSPGRTLGKEINFFYLKNSLPSALPGGTRQRNSGFFLKKFFAECLQAGHSAKKLIFFI